MSQSESYRAEESSLAVKQLTIRGFDAELERAIRRLAEQERISLNKAVLRLLRRGAGLEPMPPPAPIGDALDDLVGTWSEEEAREFAQAARPFEEVDPEFWR